MSSIKVKFRKSTSDGREGTLYYQIIHNRTVRQFNSGYKLLAEEWDAATSSLIIAPGSVRRQHLIALREQIRRDIERFRRIIAELSAGPAGFTPDRIIEEFISRNQHMSFFRFMETVIARLRKLGKRRTAETYTTALNSFRRFYDGDDIRFDEIDSELMEEYEAHLTGKGLIPNSTSFHMRILRAVYNRATDKGLTDDRRPFRHVYTGVDKTTKRAINLNALKKIKSVNLGKFPKADYARDIFMLSFFLRGMSFIDMAYLKKSDLCNGQLTYRRRKTGQLLTVKWRPEMQAILNKYQPDNSPYLLPIITSATTSTYNQYRTKQYLVNTGLKTVALHIGLNMPLTLYCSRHSWASIAKAKGIPVGVISDGLGHDSEQTTQIYLSTLDTSAVDNANALIIASL